MLKVTLNLQLTGISHQDSLVLEVRGQVSNAFCTFLSLCLSVSLSLTHTHTQSDLPPFIVLQRGKRNSEPQTQNWQQVRGESRPSLQRSWHSSWCNNNQPPSPQGSVLPLLPSHFWEGSSTPTRELRNWLCSLNWKSFHPPWIKRCQGENLEEARS